MPSYKLCYFNSKGFAEMSRLLFAEAGVTFEDKRFTREEWPQQKLKMLFGHIPVLFVDGEQIAHSRAILRYLAREFKLDGGSALSAAKVDMWIEVFFEAFFKMPLHGEDEAERDRLAKIAFQDHVIPRLGKVQESIVANKGVYLFGEEPTAADFAIYAMMENMRTRIGSDVFLDAVPSVRAMVAAIEARPKISKYLQERPVTET